MLPQKDASTRSIYAFLWCNRLRFRTETDGFVDCDELFSGQAHRSTRSSGIQVLPILLGFYPVSTDS